MTQHNRICFWPGPVLRVTCWWKKRSCTDATVIP